MTGVTNRGRRSAWQALTVAVLVAAAWLCFAGLGGYPLLDPDEGRYAAIAREMWARGDFVVPHLNGVPYLEKPPLFYWITAGCLALAGPAEWAVRLPAACAGLGTVILLLAFGQRFLGPPTGRLAAWVYITGLVPLAMTRLAVTDGCFTFLLTLTWTAWWWGRNSPAPRARRRWYLIFWAALGLAAMTKGIAAFVLTAAIVGGYVLLFREWSVLRHMRWGWGLLILTVICVPWHWAVEVREPGFLHFFIGEQHFGRLASLEHAKAWWFFLAVLPAGGLFWTWVSLPALGAGFSDAFRFWRPQGPRGLKPESAVPAAGEPEAGLGSRTLVFLCVWLAAVVLLFSVSRCKLVPYILPAYPPLALLIARYLGRPGSGRVWLRGAGVLTGALALAAVPVLYHLALEQTTAPWSAIRVPLRAAVGALVLGGVLVLAAVFRTRYLALAVGLMMMLLAPAGFMAVGMVAEYRKVGILVKGLPLPLPGEVKVADWRSFDQSLGFYTGRRVYLVDEVDELAFGRARVADAPDYFRSGPEGIRELAASGPLLINIRPADWDQARAWGFLAPVAANSTNLFLGNRRFFEVTGLEPCPSDGLGAGPLLRLPRTAGSPGPQPGN